jgi:sugar/nucleoside kinase (ribokinase family)
MAQSQQAAEGKFFAVDFRGVQQASRERTSLGVAGGAGLAVLADLPAPPPEAIEREADAEPRPQQVTLTDARLDLGGEAARAAYAYAALGGLVRLATTVGQDAAGDVVLRWLEGRGVDVAGVRRAGRTVVALHLAAGGYQPQTLAPDVIPDGPEAPEAGPALTETVMGARGSTFLLAGYPYVGALRGAGAAALLEAARNAGVRTVLSLSPVALGGPGQPLAPGDLEAVLPFVDLVCGSAAELRRATRRADPHEASRALIGAGARSVLLKRGAEGAAVFRPGPAALEREDTSTSAAAASPVWATGSPLRRAAVFGAVYDAAYLLGVALNDASPVRFASAAATRAAASPSGLLGL